MSFAIFRHAEFPANRVLPYWTAQLTGGILGGLAILWLSGPFIAHFKAAQGLAPGGPGSQLSAIAFTDYSRIPPCPYGTGEPARALISPFRALAVEAFGTGVLVLMIFSLVDRHNAAMSAKHLAPFFIGFTVAVLIGMFAPLTQAGWNPARDFGPRIVAYFAGWGGIAIPGPSSGFWVYIAGPLIGGPIGAFIHESLVRPLMKQQANETD